MRERRERRLERLPPYAELDTGTVGPRKSGYAELDTGDTLDAFFFSPLNKFIGFKSLNENPPLRCLRVGI